MAAAKSMFQCLEENGGTGPAWLLEQLVGSDERDAWQQLFCPPVLTNAEAKERLGYRLGKGSFMSAYEDTLFPGDRVIGRAHESFGAKTCEDDSEEAWNLEHHITSIRAGIKFRAKCGGEPSQDVVAVEGFTFIVHSDGRARILLMLRRYTDTLRKSPMMAFTACADKYKLAAQMCRSLLQSAVAVHRAGIVQNDASPANVGVTQHDNGDISVKLCDFGSAKPLGAPTFPANYKNPCYMSPEELAASVKGHNYTVDDSAVSWSVGWLMLYILQGGKAPFNEMKPATAAAPGTTLDATWRARVEAELAAWADDYGAKVKKAEDPKQGGNAWLKAALMLMNPDPTERKTIDYIWSAITK